MDPPLPPEPPTLCGAKTQNGTCKRPAMTNGRCYMHGGKTPHGIASPHFQHGRYSKHLPSRLVERYQEAHADINLGELREEIALIDTRLADVLTRVDTGECHELWRATKDAAQAVQRLTARANAATDPFKQRELARDRDTAIENLLYSIDAGVQDWGTWNEVKVLVEHRRRLAESEYKRLQMLKLMVPVEEVTLLKSAIVDAIRTHITDPDQLRAVCAALDKLG